MLVISFECDRWDTHIEPKVKQTNQLCEVIAHFNVILIITTGCKYVINSIKNAVNSIIAAEAEADLTETEPESAITTEIYTELLSQLLNQINR